MSTCGTDESRPRNKGGSVYETHHLVVDGGGLDVGDVGDDRNANVR